MFKLREKLEYILADYHTMVDQKEEYLDELNTHFHQLYKKLFKYFFSQPYLHFKLTFYQNFIVAKISLFIAQKEMNMIKYNVVKKCGKNKRP